MSDSLTSVAVYRRTVHSSLERVRENVHDWEHLPWLHCSSFSAIELLERDAHGWRARLGLQPAAAESWLELELRFEPGFLRYVARTLEGAGKGTEIWTELDPQGPDQTRIAVEFLVPGVAPGQSEALGAAFTRLYTQLWDEDEGMMQHRQAQLDAHRARSRERRDELELGPLAELRTRLPLSVELWGQPYRVLELDGELVAHSSVCPHMLGPLDCARLEDGLLRCPWHGYRFDPRSGANADGRRLKLAPAPEVRVDLATGLVSLRGPV